MTLVPLANQVFGHDLIEWIVVLVVVVVIAVIVLRLVDRIR